VRKAGKPLTRRELLKQAGLAGAAAAIVPASAIAPADRAPAAVVGQAAVAAVRAREPLEALTSAEADVLDAVCARLIPTDANGPGATEARAAHYIDRALAGFLAPNRQAYAAGLAAIDRHAVTSYGAAFSRLGPAGQDAVLKDVETGKADGLPSGFFTLVRTHTIQGTFCDPFYGGNANFVGWDLLGYPGVRTVVTEADQRIGITLTPNHKSAYDYAMFTKATARVGEHEHEAPGLGARGSGRQDSGGSRGHGDPA
jgi:gluconate 2-dehydrogenase gamma chain